MPGAKSTSAVWQYFKVNPTDSSKAICSLCPAVISRGRSSSTYTTSSLRKHLTRHSIKLENSVLNAATLQSPGAQHFPLKRKRRKRGGLLKDCAKRQCTKPEKSDTNELNKRIGEMLALEYLPPSFIEHVGFKRVIAKMQPAYNLPSKAHFAEIVFPDLYNSVQCKLKAQLSEAASPIYGSAEIWRSTQQVNYMNLAAHFMMWRKGELQQKVVFLACSQLENNDTAANMMAEIKNHENHWNLTLEALVTDNSNVIEALSNGSKLSIRSMAHSIDLVVKQCLANAQSTVTASLAQGKKVVGCFACSPRNSEMLRKRQRANGKVATELLQATPERWQSLIGMLERLILLKEDIEVLSVEERTETLKPEHWKIITELVTLLNVFAIATSELSTEVATLSIVLPLRNSLLQSIRQFLLDHEMHDSTRMYGMGSFLAQLKEEMQRRFAIPVIGKPQDRDAFFYSHEIYVCYALAAMLDPRVKLSWAATSEKSRMTDILETAAMECVTPATTSSAQKTASSHHRFAFKSLESEETQLKGHTAKQKPHSVIRRQVEKYLSAPRLEQTKCPLQFWASYRLESPTLFQLAMKYLSCPPTSVCSEQLFHSPDTVFSPIQNNLSTSNVETLTFLHHNIPRLNFDY